MYGSASRRSLGEVAECDLIGNDGLMPGDPGYDSTLAYDEATGCWVRVDSGDITLTPTTIITQQPPAPTSLYVLPIAVDRTSIPQPLPPLTVKASRSPLLLVGLLAAAFWWWTSQRRAR